MATEMVEAQDFKKMVKTLPVFNFKLQMTS